MSTSGSWNFSATAGDIVRSALEDLGIVPPGATVSSALSAMALQRLNFIAKQWQANSDLAPGLKIWTRQKVFMFLAKGQQQYSIGPASTDARATTQYGRTTLSAAEAGSQTTLSITSNTDTTTFPGTTVTMTSGDLIAIVLDDGTLHWDVITGTPTTTADIVTGLASAAASGNYVYWFTSRAQRFPLIETASLRNSNLNDMPLALIRTVEEYEYGIPDKYADGSPTSIFVEPLRIATRVTLDTQPTDVTEQIVMSVLYPAEDYDATTDDIAFPQEWYAALSWELAFRMSGFAGRWTQEMKDNHANALAMARSVNPEVSSIYFQPNA